MSSIPVTSPVVSSTRIRLSPACVRTVPPLSVACFAIGAQSLSGWLPSRKAVLLPCVSLMNRFMAVRMTVMESLSLSMKSSALPMAMNSSSRTRSGMKFFFIHCCTDSSSCALMYS